MTLAGWLTQEQKARGYRVSLGTQDIFIWHRETPHGCVTYSEVLVETLAGNSTIPQVRDRVDELTIFEALKKGIVFEKVNKRGE